MNLFKRLQFSTWGHKDVIANDFLDKESDNILAEFDKEYRFKEVNDLPYPQREVKTNLIYAATSLWKRVINASHHLYKKVQILEASYSKTKSELDNKLYYELRNLETGKKELREERELVLEEITRLEVDKRAIEAKFNKVGADREVKGDLKQLPTWVFIGIMSIAGLAELFIYKNVFLSQEIGLMADMALEDKWLVDMMALGMASGFTLMIIWLAHKLGEMLRHWGNLHANEVKAHTIKFIVIGTIVLAAIISTVIIRGQMHEILAKDQKVSTINNQIDDASSSFTSGGSFGGENPENSLDGDSSGFGDGEGGFGNDEGGFGEDEGGFGNEARPTTKATPKVNTTNGVLQRQSEQLRAEVVEEKGATALLFIWINLFIVVGGIVLAYSTHTSSVVYETILDAINRLEKEQKHLKKNILKLDKKIMKFKDHTINRLFTELLYRAALYDKEVRTYNTYVQIFELKMEMIENYLKNIYETKDIVIDDINYQDLIKDKVVFDYRKELHHVNTIEEYLIYDYKKPTKVETHNEKGAKNV